MPPLDEIVPKISVGKLHAGQIAAYHALRNHRFAALRCGRRFGKTDYAKTWIASELARGRQCAWLSPQHMTSAEVFRSMVEKLRPLIESYSLSSRVIRLHNGGRLDFWTLENRIAGRSRGYHALVIDEAAYAKNGDANDQTSMMGMWECAIRPTLVDHSGRALVCSNTNGKNPDNFFFYICTEPRFGFKEYHARTMDNPLLPMRLPGESEHVWLARRQRDLQELKDGHDPLVHAQEYLAEFVDWAGVAFFSREKLLIEGQPADYPARCDYVFAVIDTASKTGSEHDGTAVTYFAYDRLNEKSPLLILDWDIVQIEGSLLEAWLPQVFERLTALERQCGARAGSAGVWIEDKNSGTILLQQATRRGMPVQSIDSKLTSLGKDERAISVSGYVFRNQVKYTRAAYDKQATYKTKTRNHLVEQIERFRPGDAKNRSEDDLLDTFCYGIAIALGNSEGF